MYETFFGLNRAPFSMISDPDALFFTEGHREAFAGLSYAIKRRKGFAVLYCEAGTRKTTLIRKLLQFLPETGAQVSLVLNPVLSAGEFLELVLISLGFSDLPRSKTQRLLQLERLLCKANLAGRTPVLIIDYMEFRWRWAGSTEAIPFTEDALHLIAASSRGILRVINAICDSALLLAYGDRSRTVSAAAIREAVAELDLAPKIETPPSAANTNGIGHGNASQRSSQAVEVPHAASRECMPLRLETLDRYSAVERGLFGFHWRWWRKDLLSARPVDKHEQNLQSVKTV